MSNESVPPVTAATAATAPLENPPTDKELLHAHIEGDSTAFGTLIARHRDRLWAVALRTTGDPRRSRRRAARRPGVRLFRRASQFPRRVGRHHVAAPNRGERQPGSAPTALHPQQRSAA